MNTQLCIWVNMCVGMTIDTHVYMCMNTNMFMSPWMNVCEYSCKHVCKHALMCMQMSMCILPGKCFSQEPQGKDSYVKETK